MNLFNGRLVRTNLKIELDRFEPYIEEVGSVCPDAWNRLKPVQDAPVFSVSTKPTRFDPFLDNRIRTSGYIRRID